MGKYTRDLETAVSVNGQSIVPVSEETTDELFKVSVNFFTQYFESAILNNKGVLNSIGTAVTGSTSSHLNLSSNLDYDDIAIGSNLVIDGTDQLVRAKFGFPEIYVAPGGSFSAQAFTYQKPYWAVTDSAAFYDGGYRQGLFEIGNIVPTDCVINGNFDLTGNSTMIGDSTITGNSVVTGNVEHGGDLYSTGNTRTVRATAIGEPAYLYPNGVRVNDRTPIFCGQCAAQWLGPFLTRVVISNSLTDNHFWWSAGLDRYQVQVPGYYKVTAILNWFPNGVDFVYPELFRIFPSTNAVGTTGLAHYSIPALDNYLNYNFSTSVTAIYYLAIGGWIAIDVEIVGGSVAHAIADTSRIFINKIDG